MRNLTFKNTYYYIIFLIYNYKFVIKHLNFIFPFNNKIYLKF